METLKPVMLAGTGSDVGKSVLATALCRIFLQDGYRPAPFKAQNMALNSYATPDGLEIGRAQAVQAEACGLQPHVDMNPLLLKPNSNHTSQVVLLGRPIGNRSARQYFKEGNEEELRKATREAYDRLASCYNPMVLEGAGSISELNLKEHDLVNMSMARYADAAILLVADIDRGGVFASCYGSVMLQSPEDRKRICGIVINKFRGDISLFEEGRNILESVCGVPVLGVVPYVDNLHIDAEDSVSLERKNTDVLRSEGKISIAVILLRHISNFTDFDILERDSRVNLFYASSPSDLSEADIVILPGTKSTLDDLDFLRRSGMGSAILEVHAAGKTIIGICGGFQMLGELISDPDGIEGSLSSMPGLGLLPMQTTMTTEKTTRQIDFLFRGVPCKGYEIHQGQSTLSDPVVVRNNCIGTYIHGFLDNPVVIDYIVGAASPSNLYSVFSVQEEREKQYNLLAEHVRRYMDIPQLYKILKY